MSGKILSQFLMLGVILLLTAAAPVYAGFGGSAVPYFPAAVQVGDEGVNVSLEVMAIVTAGDTGPVIIDDIKLIPSCGMFTGTGLCTASAWDPGVFSVSATGTGADACTGFTFSIVETDVTSGEVTFLPDAVITLDSLEVCRIDFTVNVVQLPAIDFNSINTGIQTIQEARVAILKNGFLVGTGSG